MSQAYSIGTGKRSTDVKPMQGPGPGAYNPEKKQKVIPPSHRIPQATRTTSAFNQAPGPGAYESSYNKNGPQFSMAGKKSQNQLPFSPGPGAYNPKLKQSGPGYSFGSKYDSSLEPHLYGDSNEYLVHAELNAPCTKFGTSKRDGQHTDRTPGPGQYQPKFRPETAPRYGFGTSNRRDLYDSEAKKNPGPGTYDAPSAFEGQDQRGFTLISRREVGASQLHVPGPGAYDPQGLKRPPSCKIGRQQRGHMALNNYPGPGEYEDKHEAVRPASSKIRIGSAQRRPLHEGMNAPGPGAYEITSKIVEGPRVSILGHKYDASQGQKLQIPGPGQYEQGTPMYRPQSAKIGTARRSDLAPQRDQPGPGNYGMPKMASGPKFSFGTGSRPPLNPKNDTPGPGGYEAPGEIGQLPKYSRVKQ